MIHLVPFFLCLAGFTLLALAMNRQQKEVFRRNLTRPVTRVIRITGACVLLLALGVIVAQQGWGLGLVIYSGHTSLAAGMVYSALIIRALSTAHSS
jgi:hypothetical protein